MYPSDWCQTEKEPRHFHDMQEIDTLLNQKDDQFDSSDFEVSTEITANDDEIKLFDEIIGALEDILVGT